MIIDDTDEMYKKIKELRGESSPSKPEPPTACPKCGGLGFRYSMLFNSNIKCDDCFGTGKE